MHSIDLAFLTAMVGLVVYIFGVAIVHDCKRQQQTPQFKIEDYCKTQCKPYPVLWFSREPVQCGCLPGVLEEQ